MSRWPPERLILYWAIRLHPEQRPAQAASGGEIVMAQPDYKYRLGERVQIAVRPVRDGYLYAFSQKQGQQAVTVHRNSDTLHPGKEEQLLPADCFGAPAECWLTLPTEYGTVLFTVVYSRKKIPNLLSVIARAGADVQSARGDIRQLNASRGLKVEQLKGENVFLVINTDRLAEEMIVTIPFTIAPTQRATSSAAP